MTEPQLERLKPQSVRQKLVQALAFARDLRPSREADFSKYMAGLLSELRTESPTYPLRRFLDCLREADTRHRTNEHEFPTETLARPLVAEFGLGGQIVSTYLAGLPGFTQPKSEFVPHLEHHNLEAFRIGLARVEKLLDLPDVQAAFMFDNPEWRAGTLLICEDLLHRLSFSRTLATQKQLSANDEQDLIGRVYTACANSRGIISGPNVKGIFDRFFRDSLRHQKALNTTWLAHVNRFPSLHRLVQAGSTEAAAFTDTVKEQLSSNSILANRAAATVLAAELIPIDLWIAKRLCNLVSSDNACAKNAANALRTGSFSCDEAKKSTVCIIEARLDNLKSRTNTSPKQQLTIERFTKILTALTREIDHENDPWGEDFTAAP